MAEVRRRRLLATLRARFDGAALQVALPGQPANAVRKPSATQLAQWAPLQAWSFEGAGTGSSPLLRPTQAPQVELPFSAAVWPADDPTALDLIDAFSRHLDGSHQLLAAGGALAELRLRLRVKARDVMWWRRRQASDPWDCGYALDAPETRAALARFEPRRATLMVAVGWPDEALVDAVMAMRRSSPRFAHPVRWLVVQNEPGTLTGRLSTLGAPVKALQPRAAEA